MSDMMTMMLPNIRMHLTMTIMLATRTNLTLNLMTLMIYELIGSVVVGGGGLLFGLTSGQGFGIRLARRRSSEQVVHFGLS